jgi:hypothetical protein
MCQSYNFTFLEQMQGSGGNISPNNTAPSDTSNSLDTLSDDDALSMGEDDGFLVESEQEVEHSGSLDSEPGSLEDSEPESLASNSSSVSVFILGPNGWEPVEEDDFDEESE